MGGADAETVDLGEVARSIARRWRLLLAGIVVGLVVAAALVLAVPPRYRGVASLLLRNGNDPAGSLLARFGVGGDVAASAGGGLGNVFRSPMETELKLLGSRDVLGEVVDSLGLQARVRAPRGMALGQIVAEAPAMPGAFRRVRVAFMRRADGRFDVGADGPDGRVAVTPSPVAAGEAVELRGVGRLRLAREALPATFVLQLEDREDAITRLEKRLTVEKQGGEVASIEYAAPDSLAAAEVPNALVAVYLQRRRTVDRGYNQRRSEFLSAQLDSLERRLAVSEDALRREQEATGLFDPELAGQSGAEALQVVQTSLGQSEAERISARRVVAEVERGTITPRQLTAFPTFLKSAAINSLLSQLSQLETERTRLLERRTPRDPEVVALTQSIADVERQFLPLGLTYVESLDRQSAEFTRQARVIERRLAALPRQAEGNLRGQREVKRLSQTVLGLQAELVETRLAALAEGGQVRQVDVARAPKEIRFPRPLPTFAAGAVLGLVAAAVAAAALGAAGPRVSTDADVERAAGLEVLRYGADEALLRAPGSTVLLVPVGATTDAGPLAEAIVARADARGGAGAVVALGAVEAGARAPAEAVRLVRAAEQRGEGTVVVVGAGSGLDDARTAAALEAHRAVLLVARSGATRRRDLADAAAALERLAVPVLGVVLLDRDGRAPHAGLAPHARRNGTRPSSRAFAGAGADGA